MTGPIDTLPPLRDFIRRHGLSARRSLGQNFLLDLNLAARIARGAGPLEGVTVIEIGPGPGGLTRALLALGAEHVVAVERDPRSVAALTEIVAHFAGRLTIVEADAMRFDAKPSRGRGSRSDRARGRDSSRGLRRASARRRARHVRQAWRIAGKGAQYMQHANSRTMRRAHAARSQCGQNRWQGSR